MLIFPPAARDSDNEAANSARYINCYREQVGGRVVLPQVEGQTNLATLGGVNLRAMVEAEGKMYAAIAGRLKSVTVAGTVADLVAIPNAETTMTNVSDPVGNSDYVVFSANGTYYVYNIDTDTLTTPTGGAFTSVGSVDFLNQYILMTEEDGSRFQWTNPAAPETLDAAQVATAERRPDKLRRVLTVGSYALLFGTQSVEVWYPDGSGASAFKPLPGGVYAPGLKARLLATKGFETCFFCGSDNKAYITDGGQPTPVSTPAVETALKDGSPTHCFYTEEKGRKFFAIRFSDRPAWRFDLTSREWHERATAFGPWNSLAAVSVDGTFYTGTELGRISQVTGFADGTRPLQRQMTSMTIETLPNGASLDFLSIGARTGRTNLGRDAQMWARFSRDGGQTWGNPKLRSLGDQGEYETQINYENQGYFRRRVTVELNCTEPAEIAFYADADVRMA